jgi:hypothetical protein
MFSRIWSGMPAKTVCRRLHIERTEISKAQGPVAMLQERPTHDGGIGGRLLLQLHMFDRDHRADRHAALAPPLRAVLAAGGRKGSRQCDRSLGRCSALAQISFSAGFYSFLDAVIRPFGGRASSVKSITRWEAPYTKCSGHMPNNYRSNVRRFIIADQTLKQVLHISRISFCIE